MNKLYAILIAVAGVLLLGVAVALYVLRPSAEATAPIEAIALPTPAPEETADGELTVYRINQAESQARFELDEDLRGQRITVVGITDQLAGELAVNLNDLSQTQVGVIQINARALTTDNGNRNRAMQNQVLQTGSHEFITFTPTAVTGLPDSAALGETITFTIVGELTIRSITNPVSFQATATAVSPTQINGQASAVIDRGDYNLVITNGPSVANVDEEVKLHIDFTAIAP